ncbi:unnamed protein product, partial [Mesorhabditis spiculigera]
MTSLARQLEALRGPTAKQLTVEKRHVSLLYEQKEAKTLDRETMHKIGNKGLDELKQLDPRLAELDELFDEANINFQRTMIAPAQNEELTNKIKQALLLLSPYMEGYACKQALELLVYRYKIYAFDAETFLLSFLPYHETNFFGRILSILELDYTSQKDLQFLETFARKRMPVPFNMLAKHAFSGTNSILSRVNSHILESAKTVGNEWLEAHATALFAFHAKILLSVLDDEGAITDNLLSKVIPIAAAGVKSPLSSLRYSSLMVICKLAVSVKMTASTTSNLLKLILFKVRPGSTVPSLSTVVVLCQQQGVSNFSAKALLKLLRRESELGFFTALQQILVHTDFLRFLIPFWKTLFTIVDSGVEEDVALADAAILSSVDLIVNGAQMSALLDIIIERISDGYEVPRKLAKSLYSLCARYPVDLDLVRKEWEARNSVAFLTLTEASGLEPLLMQIVKGTLYPNVSEPKDAVIIKKPVDPAAVLDTLQNDSDFAREKPFVGDPLRKALDWAKASEWENVETACNEMIKRKTYVSRQMSDDVEELIFEMTRKYMQEPSNKIPVSGFRAALSEAPITPKFILWMLTRQEETGSAEKKAKTTRLSNRNCFAAKEEYIRRLRFAIEFLAICTKLPQCQEALPLLFSIVRRIVFSEPDLDTQPILQLGLAVLRNMLLTPGSIKFAECDLDIATITDAIQKTRNQHVLREGLRLLTVATKIAPVMVTKYILQNFAFMGDGRKLKDNELIMGILEDSIQTIFEAVMTIPGSAEATSQKLVEVCKMWACVVPDLPGHRRVRLSIAIAKAIPASMGWVYPASLYSQFCVAWNKPKFGVLDRTKVMSALECYDVMACEMISGYPPVEQLACIVDLLKFVISVVRHYRFVLISTLGKMLSSRDLYKRLSRETDEDLIKALLPIGRRLLMGSIDLDDFVQKNMNEIMDGNGKAKYMAPEEVEATKRYWMALIGKTDYVSQKLRHLLPANISTRLITDLLTNPASTLTEKEKALALCNAKLQYEVYYSEQKDSDGKLLIPLIDILNGFIGPEKSQEKVLLCQNASFSLKLIAKRLRPDKQYPSLSETMQKCVAGIEAWTSLDDLLVGNLLLLAGELVRSHNMGTTVLAVEPIIKGCLSILSHNKVVQPEEERAPGPPGGRKRLASLSGRPRGNDALQICALICVQRIVDKFASFVAPYLADIYKYFAQLAAAKINPQVGTEFCNKT